MKSVASLLFPQIRSELTRDLTLSGQVDGLFAVSIYKKSSLLETWYLDLCPGKVPIVSQSKPSRTGKVVSIELQDRDLYNFITGGLPGIKALAQKRIKISGDLMLAQELEGVFTRAGGVQKAKEFLKKSKRAKL